MAERLNRTLIEMVRSMLSGCKMSQVFWAEALSTAVCIRNRCPTKAVQGKTPYEALTGKKPKVGHLRVFGCAAYFHIAKDERHKLDSKSRKCVFMGYSDNRKGYRLFDDKKRKIIHSRDVTFNELVSGTEKDNELENETSYVRIEYPSEDEEVDGVSNNESSDELDDTEPDHEEEPAVRRSTRERKCPDHFGVWVNIADVKEPATVAEAQTGPDREKWKDAMDAEYKSLISNNVWELVELPKNSRVISSKWIFKCKIGATGIVERYKARLVAQGYSQRPGVDYEETFAPVVRFESIRTVVALAVQNNLKLHQMDITTAFLNGVLKEVVYMKQPEGYIQNSKEKLVCQLKRSIYGLKQSPRCWNTALDSQLKKMGFIQTTSDPCLYVSSEGEPFIIAVYVDDILLAGKTDSRIVEVKNALASKFNVKDMGELKYFLGVKVIQDIAGGNVWIGQPSYTETILQQFSMTEAKSVKTPVNPSIKLSKATDESKCVDPEMYQSAVGKLLYLSTRTRPDVTFAVCNVAKYTSNPTEEHWKAVKHILRYLVGTINYGLLYNRADSSSECCGYSDADWAGDLDDRKSTSGYVFQVGGAPVSWRSCKQSSVALSTAEAEYIALSSAAQEAIWMRTLLSELKRESTKPALIYEDNQAAICLSKNPQFHGRSKHIEIKYHFIRDQVKNGVINVKYCKTDDMTADIMTKGLYGERFSKLRRIVGVIEMKDKQ